MSRSSSPGHEQMEMSNKIIVTTGNDIPGYRITEFLGVVRGVIVRSASIKQGLMGGFKQIFGGNIEAYAQVCDAARQDAFQRMVEHAAELEADAVIGMRYDATEFAQAATEVLAYGTAVKLTRS
jgi:uncharacterized protein YbjQ (UPF0145 family)